MQLFTGCATRSICDPACFLLVDARAKSQCLSECTTKGYQYQIDCVNKAACDKARVTCGGIGEGSTGPTVNVGVDAGGFDIAVKDCESACDSINFFECASVEDHASCRARLASTRS